MKSSDLLLLEASRLSGHGFHRGFINAVFKKAMVKHDASFKQMTKKGNDQGLHEGQLGGSYHAFC